ncbi:linear amide C-N hydrolase [Streptomyces sp. KN37]|uniref:linear amide C-N hydrolase n=1 Tax=Streptomyces sp. KN37 TaxID=3090667 RepID=UPI002A755685|nr:linear amide C-N hydrolase [Streptomyces sp. KN37]WPO75142.1 linear amide C-N hydrolase [Streptomyces sp. KN37]
MGTDDRCRCGGARYGRPVAIAYDSATTAGINEAGLGAHLPWLAESDYGERDPRLPTVSAALWMRYLLDRFPTVAEAADALEVELSQVRPQGDAHAGTWSMVHLALDHAMGDSAVVECGYLLATSPAGTSPVNRSPSPSRGCEAAYAFLFAKP